MELLSPRRSVIMAPEFVIMGHHVGDITENEWPPPSERVMVLPPTTLLAYCSGEGGSSGGYMPRWRWVTVELLVQV